MPEYRIEYVEHKELISLLQAAHDYAAANEHRADYWTCMAAYLAAEGLTYRYTPPKGPLCLHDGIEDASDCIHAIRPPTE